MPNPDPSLNSAQGISDPAGVMTVLPTPFDERGRVDHNSLERLVDHAISEGSRALVCFGLASELYKLTDFERISIVDTVLRTNASRVPVIAGSEQNSVEAAASRTGEYCEAGVSAVMVLPPSYVKPDQETVVSYYREVALAASGKPVIIQDAPTWSGVTLPVSLLSRVRDSAPSVSLVKVENPPNYEKIVALRDAGFECIGGYGALHLLEDVDAGVRGVMYGAGTIQAMVGLWESALSDHPRSWLVFQEMLPLLAFQMSSLDTFIAVQKHILHTTGVLSTPYVRQPGRPLSEHQIRWLEQILQRLKGLPL